MNTDGRPDEATSVAALLGELRQQLADAGIAHPEADAELIIGHVLGESRGRVQALAIMGNEIVDEDRETARGLAAARSERVPLQHLTGRAPFREIELSVGPGVFVPRPETEIVAQHAIDLVREAGDPAPIVVDLCTGSAAIAIAIANEVDGVSVWAVEKSVEAHAWATRNVAQLGHGRVELLLGDVRELDPRTRPYDQPVSEGAATGIDRVRELRGRVHVLVSNPPYVPEDCVPRDPEVRDHDPELALYSGADGLELIRVISRVASELVRPGGSLVLEHAEGQGAQIRSLLTMDGWRNAETYPDLTGRDRATIATRRLKGERARDE